MSDIEQKLREDVARAWASIDGKVDQFDLEKNNPNLAYDDPAYVGSYEGYMAEANELLKRSGVGPLIASLRAKLEEAEQRYVDANEARLDCIRALHEVVEAMMPGQARRIARAALSQKETGHGA